MIYIGKRDSVPSGYKRKPPESIRHCVERNPAGLGKPAAVAEGEPMPRCFFHLKNRSEVILDAEGIDLADQPSIVARTLKEARCILSHDLQLSGRLPLGYRIEVEDGNGSLLHVLEFADAVSIESGRLSA